MPFTGTLAVQRHSSKPCTWHLWVANKLWRIVIGGRATSYDLRPAASGVSTYLQPAAGPQL